LNKVSFKNICLCSPLKFRGIATNTTNPEYSIIKNNKIEIELEE